MIEQRQSLWRSRIPRRVVVLLWALCLVGLVLWALLGERTELGMGWFGLYVLWLVPLFVLRSMTQGVTERPVAQLDEWELKFRNRFLAVGYYTSLFAGAIVAIYLVTLSHVDPTGVAQGAQLLLVSVGLAAAIPTVGLAWTMQDEDPDDFGT